MCLKWQSYTPLLLSWTGGGMVIHIWRRNMETRTRKSVQVDFWPDQNNSIMMRYQHKSFTTFEMAILYPPFTILNRSGHNNTYLGAKYGNTHAKITNHPYPNHLHPQFFLQTVFGAQAFATFELYSSEAGQAVCYRQNCWKCLSRAGGSHSLLMQKMSASLKEYRGA